MSNTNLHSQGNRNWSWLPILTSGLFLGVCLGTMIFIGLVRSEKDTTKAQYFLAVNAYYAGCLQGERTGAKNFSKKKCQDSTDHYANEMRVVGNE